MLDMPIWVSLVLMLPVVFATALVSAFMRFEHFKVAFKETMKLTLLIVGGILCLSVISFALHYLFGGGVVWR